MSKCVVIRGSSPTHTHPGPTHCLSRAGLSPLQSSAPGPLLKCILVWAELVGSIESPSESHTVCVPAWVTLKIVFALSHLQIALELERWRWVLTNWSCLLCISSFLEHSRFKECLQANIWQFIFKVSLWELICKFMCMVYVYSVESLCTNSASVCKLGHPCAFFRYFYLGVCHDFHSCYFLPLFLGFTLLWSCNDSSLFILM